ncbi:MAG: hypothetical protein IT373_30845 [Polyangiaceae bacterium]|nr:hypothetical protein [Polyangiaceae bacterium]
MSAALAKIHSTTMARAYLRVGWRLKYAFRENPGAEPYEYILQWPHSQEPRHPPAYPDGKRLDEGDELLPQLQPLEFAVRALAQSANVQTTLFPPFVVVGDELATDFEEAVRSCAVDDSGATTVQRDALQRLSSYLTAFSGPPNEDLWLDPAALATDERWKQIRVLALEVVLAFG